MRGEQQVEVDGAVSRRGVNLPDAQATGLLSAVVALRLAVLVWASVVVGIDISGVARIRGTVALLVLGLLATWTLVFGSLVRRRPDLVARPYVCVLDVVVAASIAAIDHYVYTGPHPQSFASAWPMSAAVIAGVLHGARGGAAAGGAIGLAGAAGTALFVDTGLDGRWTAALGTLVLLVVSGVLAGLVTAALRRADATEARAQAREDVARRLHDGVLQTLAVVQRRSDDPGLVALAREQELDLRQFITDEPDLGTPLLAPTPRSGAGLVPELRDTLSGVERRTGVRCELVVVETPQRISDPIVRAVCGATAEGVTNAEKHGSATRVIVCVDVDADGSLVCTVNDDGSGFDTDRSIEGHGLRRSVRGRLEEVGGTVEVVSQPGRGCELTFRVPST